MDTRPLVFSILKTMRNVFAEVYVIATVDPDSEALQNFIFIGHKNAVSGNRVDLKQALDTDFSYPQLRQIASFELNPRDEDIDGATLLTDNYAPVEYYAAKIIRKYDASLASAD